MQWDPAKKRFDTRILALPCLRSIEHTTFTVDTPGRVLFYRHRLIVTPQHLANNIVSHPSTGMYGSAYFAAAGAAFLFSIFSPPSLLPTAPATPTSFFAVSSFRPTMRLSTMCSGVES